MKLVYEARDHDETYFGRNWSPGGGAVVVDHHSLVYIHALNISSLPSHFSETALS